MMKGLGNAIEFYQCERVHMFTLRHHPPFLNGNMFATNLPLVHIPLFLYHFVSKLGAWL